MQTSPYQQRHAFSNRQGCAVALATTPHTSQVIAFAMVRVSNRCDLPDGLADGYAVRMPECLYTVPERSIRVGWSARDDDGYVGTPRQIFE